jgi:hypothetical protein
LEALVARLLQKDKGDRFQSCVDIRQEITRILAILADGHVSEAETMAQKAETSLRPDNSRQAKTDPLIAADRAMTQILQANKKLILPAALVGLSALVAAFAWLAIINNWPGGDGHRNTLTPAPPLELARPALVPASPTAAGGRVAPPGKYLVRQTATSRIFNFPQGEPLGLLHFDKTEVAARGPVEIPKDSKCAFLATHPIALTPELLSGFGPDDLYEISFASTEEWKDRNMKWVGKLSGLRKIDLENCDLTAASIDYLNNLSRLRKICFNGIHIKAAQWCRFRPLATVADIKAEGLQDCSALVTKLKQKNSLERLELEGGDVSDATISGIACFKGLIRLKLVGNTVTSRGLKALLTLPKLNELVISKSRVGPDSMETLAALPALQELEIETGSWGLRNQRRLFDLMAAKKVRLKQTRPGRMMDP